MNDTPGLLPLARYDLIKKQASKPSTVTAPRWTSILKWWPEAVGWIASVLIVAAIVVVLHAYNGVATARWQSQMPVTLNAFLSLLVTFLYMALMIPIPKCIAQLKWNHYTTARPLSDVEIFDEASRTVWGSAVLLATRPKRLLAALGAFLTLAVAGVGPFVQQILSQEVVPRQLDGEMPTVPIFNYTSSYSGALTMAAVPDHKDVTMLGLENADVDSDSFDAAFYTGLMAPGVQDFTVTSSCAAANCTWEPYWTLVVESECANITDQFNRTSSPWVLPNSLQAYFGGCSAEYNLTTNYPSVAFQHRGHLLSDFFLTATECEPARNSTSRTTNRTATAIECILQVRAQKVRAEYTNGVWTETRIGPSIPDNGLEARACSPWRRYLASGQFDYPDIVDQTGETYPNASGEDPLSELWWSNYKKAETSTCNITISPNSSDTGTDPTLVFPALHLLGPAWRLFYLLGGDTGGIVRQQGGKNGGILNYLVSLINTNPADQYLTDQSYNISFPERIENIAKSLTQDLRASYFSEEILVSGAAYRDTVVYSVDWYWVTVPASLVVLTLLLLILTTLDTFGKGLQKRTDSSLALMVFGCDQETRQQLAAEGDLAAMTSAAKGQYVRLGPGHVLVSTERSRQKKPR